MGTEGNQILYHQYTASLPEYHQSQYDPDKCDAPKPFVGWKLHLNVSPPNVKETSEFLLKNMYLHKYISGGNIDHGKIFTVYTGSKTLTEKIIKEISDSIGHLLETPIAKGELLVAPKIVARFAAQMHPMIDGSYSYKGIPARKYWETDNKEELYQVSFDYLQNEFGEYFGGGLSYYQPNLTELQPGENFEDFLHRQLK